MKATFSQHLLSKFNDEPLRKSRQRKEHEKRMEIVHLITKQKNLLKECNQLVKQQ